MKETPPAPVDGSDAGPSLRHVRARLKMRHLVVIEALAEHLNIRQAASDLFITQPAASKLLHEIESIYGVPLFERTAHGIETTAYGDVLLHWARRGLAVTEAAHEEVLALRQGRDGRVRAGFFPVVGTTLIPEAVALLRSLRPGIRLSLQEGLETSLMPLLEQEQLDCVIGRATYAPAPRDVAYEPLFEEPTVIVCAADHPLAEHPDWIGADFDCHEWVLPARNGQLHALVATGLASVGAATPRVAVEISSILTLVEIIGQTTMLSAIPGSVARRFAASGRLSIVPLALSQSLHPVSIMTNRGSIVHAATAAFLDAVRTVAARPR